MSERTLIAEDDERIPPEAAYAERDYESLAYPYWAGDQIIVYRVNAYVSMQTRCVARTDVGDRCDAYLPPSCGHVSIHIVGTDASVEAQISPWAPECIIRQRCPAHVNSNCEDVVAPSGEPFNPVLHADTLFYAIPRWSPLGVWAPPEHKGRTRLNIHHRRECPSGGHVPLAPVDDEEEYDDDWENVPADQLIRGDNVSAEERAVPALTMPPTVDDATGSTALYRYFDADDLLLYVGISDRLRTRTGDHIKSSSWMDFAARSTIERFATRNDALTAEEIGIKAERPLFNHQHNTSPEAQRQLVEYLVRRGCLDLLAPAISRG